MENVQSWQSWQSWRYERAVQQRCLLRGQRASRTSSPERCCEPGNEPTLETGQPPGKTEKGKTHFKRYSRLYSRLVFKERTQGQCKCVTWRSGVLLSCRVLRGWTSGVLPVLLAEEPDTEAWTLPTALAWSGGTYLSIQEKIPTQMQTQ